MHQKERAGHVRVQPMIHEEDGPSDDIWHCQPRFLASAPVWKRRLSKASQSVWGLRICRFPTCDVVLHQH